MSRYRVFFEDQRTPIDVEAHAFEALTYVHIGSYKFIADSCVVAKFSGVRGVVNLDNLIEPEKTIEDIAKKHCGIKEVDLTKTELLGNLDTGFEWKHCGDRPMITGAGPGYAFID